LRLGENFRKIALPPLIFHPRGTHNTRAMYGTLKTLFYGRELEYEALKRRARRNLRTLKQELRAIVYEALAPEVEAIRREQEAEQNAKGVGDA